MRGRRAGSSPWLAWALIGLGWLAFALFFATQAVVARAYAGKPIAFKQALSPWLLCAGIWYTATPLTLWLARRFQFDRHRWLSRALIHLAASIVLSFLLLAAFVYLASLLRIAVANTSFLIAFRTELVGGFHSEMLTYWMVIGLYHGVDYYRKYRERELRASQLEARLAQAQLDALRMQLHPHFLFNTLNSISVLMSEDVTAARRMLTRLGDLLRASLETGAAHEVLLRDELEFLNNYLEIERTRFHDRLTVTMNVEPAVLSARVPQFILQPLVENAIRHGIAPRAQQGVIDISAARDNGQVRLTVGDNGPGLGTSSPEDLKKGIGLSNTQARLDQLYGMNHSFELKSAAGGGLEVTILIPFRNGLSATKGN